MRTLKPILAFALVLALAIYALAYTQPLDNFNRGDSGSLGSDWTDLSGYSIGIKTNAAAVTGNVYGLGFAAWTSATRPVSTTDEYAQGKVLVGGIATAVVTRLTASTPISGYRYGGGEIYKWVSGSQTWLVGCAGTFTANVVGKLESIGSIHKGYKNGTLDCTTSPDTGVPSGRPGMYLQGNSSAVVATLDDFTADCIPACGGAARTHRVITALANIELVPRAYAQTVAPRLYIMPKVQDAAGVWVPKYKAQLCVTNKCGALDFGPEPWEIVWGEVDSTNDAAITGNADVLALPANLDANLSAGAVTAAQNWLEARNIPADWITTSLTYRQVLRVVAQFFLFAQRYANIGNNARLFPAGVSLSTTVGQLDATTKANWQNTATSLGYSFAGITNASTLRQALKMLGQQWGSSPIQMGDATL